MDNERNQSKVAYEDGPKEVNTKRGLPNGDKQFGKDSNKMEQSNPGYKQRDYPANPVGLDLKSNSYNRHKEYR